MPDVLLRETDREDLIRDTAAAVVEAMQPTLGVDLRRPLGRDEMADWLGIGVATLDRMVKSKSIPSLKLAGCRKFVPAEVVAALTVKANPTSEEKPNKKAPSVG